MANKPKKGCVNPAGGVLQKDDASAANGQAPANQQPEETHMVARVGHEAIDFEANAFHQGGFKNVKLSEFRGKWIVLCFYPGDFTFV